MKSPKTILAIGIVLILCSVFFPDISELFKSKKMPKKPGTEKEQKPTPVQTLEVTVPAGGRSALIDPRNIIDVESALDRKVWIYHTYDDPKKEVKGIFCPPGPIHFTYDVVFVRFGSESSPIKIVFYNKGWAE